MCNITINVYDKIPGAPNFKYHELLRSDVALRHQIDNRPNIEQLKNIENVAKFCLQPTRNEFGRIRVTSGFRCDKLNTLVRGSKYSNHLRGEAVDIEPLETGITLITVLEWMYYHLEFRELIAEFFPFGWIHVAYRQSGNIRKLKLKDKNHNYEDITIYDLIDLYQKI